MSQSDIFDMEWGYEDEKKELEIDDPISFRRNEKRTYGVPIRATS